MKIQPIQQVTGIRIELTLQEALRLVQQREHGRDRVIDAISGTLQGSGIDPETGAPCHSTLGLQAAPTVMAITGTIENDEFDDFTNFDEDSELPWKCKFCGKETKTERGLQAHISRMHKA